MIEILTQAAKEAGKEGLKKSFDGDISNKIPDFKNTNLSIPEFDILKDKIPILNCFAPRTGGTWDGEEEDSTWKPDKDEIPSNPKANPEEKTWEKILKENDIEGIPFKDGEADFSEVAEGTVEIDEFSDNRYENFTQADEKLAEKWSNEQKDGKTWTPQDIRNYRKDNDLTWHERKDMKTMDLVPTEIHGNIPHSGGIAEVKQNNSGVKNA